MNLRKGPLSVQTFCRYGSLILAFIVFLAFPHDNERSEMEREQSHKYHAGRGTSHGALEGVVWMCSETQTFLHQS